MLDVNKWHSQLLGQTLYSIYGDNKNLYKEFRFKNNWITDRAHPKSSRKDSTKQREELVNT